MKKLEVIVFLAFKSKEFTMSQILPKMFATNGRYSSYSQFTFCRDK